MENENMVETIENDDVIEDTVEDTENGSSLIGKVLVGGATLAVGAGVGFAIKNRNKIKEGIKARRINRLERQILKKEAKLDTLIQKEQPSEEEKTE